MTGTRELKITEIPGTMGDEHFNTVDQNFIKDNTVCNLRYVHKEALETLTAVVFSHRDVMNDPTKTPVSNMQRSHEHAAKLKARTLEKMETAINRAHETIRDIDEAISRVPTPPEPDLRKTLSDRLFGLSADDRRKVLTKALESNDNATLAVALFWGPSWAHGLSDAERGLYVGQYQATRYPDALARKAAIQRSLEIAERSMKSLATQVDALFDEGKLRDAENRAYAAAKALESGGV